MEKWNDHGGTNWFWNQLWPNYIYRSDENHWNFGCM